MFARLKESVRTILIPGGQLLLLLAFLQFPIQLWAQEAGSENVLTGKTDLSGISLDSGMSTNVSNVVDICSNAPDKAACTKKLSDAQLKKIQVMQDANPSAQGFNQTPSLPVSKAKNLPSSSPATNEFQKFIATSTGKKLPLYGYSLFENSPDTFAPVDNIAVTQDYLIGPGDEIVINAWGQVDINFHAMVNRNGSIDLPKVGNVNVAGVRYQNLQGYLKTAIGRVFRNFELSVSLGKLRSIQVFVVGQAKQPGVYTVSSLSTLVNTLFASGGPSGYGSMRHIQLKRNGQVVTELDLYDLLLKGDKSKDMPLQPGDVIYIPPAKQYVAISGSINNAAIYELKDEKTTLLDLLELAGGLTTTAEGKKVVLERIENHNVRKVEEFQLNKEGLSRQIHDGDMVVVDQISPRFENAVKLQGNVAQPMRYVWEKGLRVTDLLKDANALIPDVYWARQNSGVLDTHYNKKEVNWDYAVVQRLDQKSLTTRLLAFDLGKAIKGDQVENMQLVPGDVITIYSADDELPQTENDVVLKGSIFSPTNRRFVWREGMHISDLIPNADWLIDYYNYWMNFSCDKNSQGDKNIPCDKNLHGNKLSAGINWGYANIIRLQPSDLTRVMVSFDLGKVVLKNDSANNLALLPGDEISVYTHDEMPGPVAGKNKFVRLEGEFKHAGVYQVQPGETLRQLVSRVGGITPQAYLFGAEFDRETVRVLQQQKLKEMIDRMEDAVVRSQANKDQSALGKDDIDNAKAQAISQNALMTRLRKIQASGRLVLEIPTDSGQLKDLPDMELEDGDRMVLPARPSVVSVMGMVYNASSFIYRPGKSVNDYLSQAGGPTRDADESRTYVLRADGSVVSMQSSASIFNGFSNQTLMPGDAIVVPEMLDKLVVTRAMKDWSQIFYQFALGAAGLKVLGL